MILQGDCRELMRAMPAASVDAVVTDPPYGIGFMGKEWDTPGALVERKADRSQKWDRVGGAHNPTCSADAARTRAIENRRFQEWSVEWSVEALRVLKPGAFLAAFGSTRTSHRLAAGLEDVGFEIRDTLMWLFGQGFPKTRTALKPAHEPIILARKPLVGTLAANVLAHGTGALNIDGCRVGEGAKKWKFPRGSIWKTDQSVTSILTDNPLGRWPANIVHDGSDEVIAAFPESEARGGAPREKRGTQGICFGAGLEGGGLRVVRSDGGSAARFFYCAKASKADRAGSRHPTVKPQALMRWLCRLITPAGGLVLDPFAGSGSTLQAALAEGFRVVGCELSPEYVEDTRRRLAA